MIHHWFHRIIRRRTKPIGFDDAYKWKRILSITYGLIAWNAFGFVIYSMYRGKTDWADYYGLKSDEEKSMSPGVAWASTLGIKNAKVYRISGLQVVDQYNIVEEYTMSQEGISSSKYGGTSAPATGWR